MNRFRYFVLATLLFGSTLAKAETATSLDDRVDEIVHAIFSKDDKKLDRVLSDYPQLINRTWQGESFLLIALLTGSELDTFKTLLKTSS